MNAPVSYVGRFAPSPSGPLHFGSLVAAAASWFDARSAGGRWLLRIDDVDTPRCVPGAAEDILATLQRFGFEWDASPVWQSLRLPAYRAAFERLREAGQLFPCACSRKELADSALASDGSRVYPGTCRSGLPAGREPRAWRVRVQGTLDFDDAIQGPQHEELVRDVGDFVVLRADGLFAYQLAAVVDDADAGVTDIVRGADLLASTSRQIVLQRLLGLATPRYAHVPVVVDMAGDKLSKQTLAQPVDILPPAAALHAALDFLGQDPPAELARAPLAEVHAWGIAHWCLEAVPRAPSGPLPAAF
ncbi:MAG: tRNA glutamyl-Q(34) synthetase GluQRS [Zoogloeaceae bacterium]|nr:tRNA glutamyl-Q(34) synthetase GluQRS [Zoogloeaceae bacterium]